LATFSTAHKLSSTRFCRRAKVCPHTFNSQTNVCIRSEMASAQWSGVGTATRLRQCRTGTFELSH
jgi:hypothetical protein